MNLIYRGVTYNSDATGVIADGAVEYICQSAYELMYRGSTYQVNSAISTLTSANVIEYELMYRGSTYQIKRNKQGEVTAIVSPVDSEKPKNRRFTQSGMSQVSGEY